MQFRNNVVLLENQIDLKLKLYALETLCQAVGAFPDVSTGTI